MSQSGEKTEKPTAKRRKDARKDGQVLKSQEINTAVCSLVMFGVMLMYLPTYIHKLMEIMHDHLGSAVAEMSRSVEVPVVQGVLESMATHWLGIVLPLFGVAMLVGVIANLLQVGFLFTAKPLKPKLSKISPIKGFKRMFSVRTLVELAKSLIKVVCLGYILYNEYSKLLTKFPSLMGADIYTSFLEILKMVFQTALKMGLVMMILAIFDYLFQWWKHEKDLKMTKQEVKDEYKQMEGDPKIKSKIKQKQRQMSMMRMMDKVPSADVVITNPTHYAVALKYEEGVSEAPVVVAKGTDFVARKIKDKARENRVEIVENKPLAQALYAMCEVGQEIPAEFYQAVADILVYVYRQKNAVRGRA